MRKLFIYTLLIVLSVFIGYSQTKPGEDSDRLKARSYYLEGAREAALGRMPEAYEYYKKAYLLDSLNHDASYNYGIQRLMLRTDTLQSETELNRSLSMIRNYIDNNPKDIYAGEIYGFINIRLDNPEEALRVYERMSRLLPSESYLLLALSDAYMMNFKPDSAVSALNRYERIEGKSGEVSERKIKALLISGDTIEAINEAKQLIAENPRDASSLVLAGKLFEAIDKSDSTLYYYQEAEKFNPDNGGVKIELAGYYLNKGDSIAYDTKIYEALLTEDFELEDKLGLLVGYLKNLLEDQGDTSRGDYLFEVLNKQYPHESEILELAAKYKGATGHFDEAAEKARYALDMNATNPDLWLDLVRYQLGDSQPQKALDSYNEAVTHVEPFYELNLMEAHAYSMLKNYSEAEQATIRIIHDLLPGVEMDSIQTDNSLKNSLDYTSLVRLGDSFNLLGDTYYLDNKVDSAFKAYENSLYFYPDNPLTLNNYAYFLAQSNGDLDKALEMSNKAISLSEDNPTFLDTYAWILFKKKDYKEALEIQSLALEQALEAGEENAEYYHHMGDILFMNHELQEALQNWEKALELEPDNELLKKKVSHKTFFFE